MYQAHWLGHNDPHEIEEEANAAAEEHASSTILDHAAGGLVAGAHRRYASHLAAEHGGEFPELGDVATAHAVGSTG